MDKHTLTETWSGIDVLERPYTVELRTKKRTRETFVEFCERHKRRVARRMLIWPAGKNTLTEPEAPRSSDECPS